jgi:hypothetical protein
MRALPFAYRNLIAEPGSMVQCNVSGDCGGSWYLLRTNARGWQLEDQPSGSKISEVTIPQEIAWRVFTKGISRDAAAAQTTITGNQSLGLHLLKTIAIVA